MKKRAVEAHSRDGEIAINRDARLEEEANRMADVVLSGGRVDFQGPVCGKPVPPVAQCLVYLDQKPGEFARVDG